MAFTPSTRYCPVHHSPSFAISQPSPTCCETRITDTLPPAPFVGKSETNTCRTGRTWWIKCQYPHCNHETRLYDVTAFEWKGVVKIQSYPAQSWSTCSDWHVSWNNLIDNPLILRVMTSSTYNVKILPSLAMSSREHPIIPIVFLTSSGFPFSTSLLGKIRWRHYGDYWQVSTRQLYSASELDSIYSASELNSIE